MHTCIPLFTHFPHQQGHSTLLCTGAYLFSSCYTSPILSSSHSRHTQQSSACCAQPPSFTPLPLTLACTLPASVGLLNGLLTSSAEVEQEMVAVERVQQYVEGCGSEESAPPSTGPARTSLEGRQRRRRSRKDPLLLLPGEEQPLLLPSDHTGEELQQPQQAGAEHVDGVASWPAPAAQGLVATAAGAARGAAAGGTAAVQFEGVWLRYQPHLPAALRDINFSVPAGQLVGVVGRTGERQNRSVPQTLSVPALRMHLWLTLPTLPLLIAYCVDVASTAPMPATRLSFPLLLSGAGKSSLVSALLRLHPIERGRILLSGADASTQPLAALRRAVGVVPQSPLLFTGSLRENLDPWGSCSPSALGAALMAVRLWRPLCTAAARVGGLDHLTHLRIRGAWPEALPGAHGCSDGSAGASVAHGAGDGSGEASVVREESLAAVLELQVGVVLAWALSLCIGGRGFMCALPAAAPGRVPPSPP